MLTQEHAEEIVIAAVKEAFRVQGKPDAIVDAETPIYGPTSDLDSLGFISACLNIEDALRAEGVEIYLAPDDTFDPAYRYSTVAAMRSFLTETL
jgi:hypothetical protein